MIQQRNIALYVVLSVVTCGLFALYWMLVLNEDANTVSKTNGTSGGMVILLSIITCGIYTIYWMYKQGEKIDAAKNERGIPSSNTGIIYLVLSLVGLGIVSYILMQDSLNKLA